MKDKFARWISSFIENLLIQLILLVFTSFVSTTAITSLLKHVSVNLSPPDRILIFLLLILSFIISIQFIWIKHSYRSYYYPQNIIKTQYDLDEKKVIYKIENNVLHYSRELIIKSNVNGLDCISDKYIWTGGNLNELPTGILGISSIEKNTNIGIWRYFRIEFDETLSKYEKKTIKYKWPLIKNYGSSDPFFSAQTDIPCKKIIFDLELGDKYANRKAVFEEMRGTEGGTPLFKEELNLGKHGELLYEVKNPRRFRYYCIRWSWDNEQIPEVPAE